MRGLNKRRYLVVARIGIGVFLVAATGIVILHGQLKQSYVVRHLANGDPQSTAGSTVQIDGYALRLTKEESRTLDLIGYAELVACVALVGAVSVAVYLHRDQSGA